MTTMGTDTDLYKDIGELKAMATQGVAEREKLFEKLEEIKDDISEIKMVHRDISTLTAKADKAHERIDDVDGHIATIKEDLGSIKTKALIVIGSSGAGGAGIGTMLHVILLKMGWI
jgi:uncharacterized coiled-coil DUF342 family protein